MRTHPAGRDRREDKIRLKNLVQQARQRLVEEAVDPSLARTLLSPIEQLPSESDWRHRSEGLAAFASSEIFRSVQMPIACPELAVVGDHFHLRPLLPLLEFNRRYFLLGLTKDSADLFEASQDFLGERHLPEMAPIAIDGKDRPFQHHSFHAPSQGHGSTGEAVFHGQGGPADRENADLLNFFKRQVEPAVAAELRDQKGPLVLACDDRLAPIYRTANTYPYLADVHISGSPVERDEKELCTRGWHAVEPLFAERQTIARDRFETLTGSSRTSIAITNILDAAADGRVEMLLVSKDTDSAILTASDAELTDEMRQIEQAIEQTLLHDGDVLAIDERLHGSTIAATYRY
jgi:Bacterial archaeo-eukaryotic release factor family 7